MIYNETNISKYSYEELKYIIDNPKKLYVFASEEEIDFFTSNIEPYENGSIYSQVKYWWIIRNREQKINEILK